MLGYFKGQPNEYVMRYSGGKLSQEGQAVSFFYWRSNTTIVTVPTNSVDVDFVFNEQTANFLPVAIQGQFTYRITTPKQVASLLDYTINPWTRAHSSEDPEKLAQRITNILQMETRREVLARSLEETLRTSEEIATRVLARVRGGEQLTPMGVELLSVHFLAAKPTPDVAKALEAEYREQLLRSADEAIYARRAAAVDEERKIKEKELKTDTTLAEQRKHLIELQGENELQAADLRGQALEKEAEYKSRALALEMEAYKTLDPKSLMALAMRDMGQNADKIGNLTITSEILAALLNGKE
jgi:regulator of protease activity HflC (stomatin/prohibitin superfamily)